MLSYILPLKCGQRGHGRWSWEEDQDWPQEQVQRLGTGRDSGSPRQPCAGRTCTTHSLLRSARAPKASISSVPTVFRKQLSTPTYAVSFDPVL